MFGFQFADLAYGRSCCDSCHGPDLTDHTIQWLQNVLKSALSKCAFKINVGFHNADMWQNAVPQNVDTKRAK